MDPTGSDDLPDYRQRQEYRGTEEMPVVIAGREAGRIPAAAFMP